MSMASRTSVTFDRGKVNFDHVTDESFSTSFCVDEFFCQLYIPRLSVVTEFYAGYFALPAGCGKACYRCIGTRAYEITVSIGRLAGTL